MRRRLWFLLCACAAVCLSAVLDRIVVTVGRRAITESDLVKEIRLSSFLNQTEPDYSDQSRKAAAKRLIDRALIAAEMQAGRYLNPDPEEVRPALESLRKSRSQGSSSLEDALRKYGLAEEDLRRYLLEQAAVLRFIDLRFGAAVQIVESDVRDYYLRQFLPEWQNKGKGPAPSFEEVREDLERLLRQQRADLLVEEWLKEAGSRVRIEFKDETLR